MDEEYLRKIQYWLCGELAPHPKVLEEIWEIGAEPEPVLLIPPPRTPLE